MVELPTGYRLYWPVLSRLADRFYAHGTKAAFRCPFGDRHRNGDRNPSAWVDLGDSGNLLVACSGCKATWKEFSQYVGLPETAWFLPKPEANKVETNHPPAKAVAHYEYRDRDGKLVAVKTRFEPGHGGRSKSFSWKRPLPEKFRKLHNVPEGVRAWVKGLDGGSFSPDRHPSGWWYGPTVDRLDGLAVELGPVEVDLYRLPELLAADPRRAVMVVEGEKDADRLAGLGYVAVCGPNGSQPWPERLGGWLADRHVVVIPDFDDPGCKLMLSVMALALAFRALSVRWVDLPNGRNQAGYDVSDFLAGLDGPQAKRQLEALVKESPGYKRGLK